MVKIIVAKKYNIIVLYLYCILLELSMYSSTIAIPCMLEVHLISGLEQSVYGIGAF